jgi:hypothetical protein
MPAASVIPRDVEEFALEFAALPQGWHAVGGVALVATLLFVVAVLYRSEGRRGTPRWAKWTAAVLRCLVIVALAVLWLEPIRARYLRRWIDSYTIVLVDDSSSMDIADTYRDAGTAERVRRLLGTRENEPVRRRTLVEHELNREDRALLRGLTERNRVRLYTFADEPTLRSTILRSTEKFAPSANPAATRPGPDAVRAARDGSTPAPTATQTGSGGAQPSGAAQSLDGVDLMFRAQGSATNIERALRRSVEALGSSPIAAVVLLSDGGINQGESADQIGRYAKERGLPVHVVGVGDPSPVRNVHVAEVLAPEYVLVRDPFVITVRLSASGPVEGTIPIELREQDAAGGEGTVVERRDVVVPPDGAIEPIVFQRAAPRPGRYTYTIVVPVQPWESVADDNVRQVVVHVVESRHRVLLVAGGPSWDYRFVSRLLERDKAFDVSCWLQSADVTAVRDGDTVIDHLPATPEELLAYDAVVLLDPDPSEFSESWCRLVDRLVTEYGGGLLFASARAYTPVFMRSNECHPIIEVLPVATDPSAEVVLNQVGHYQTRASLIDLPEGAWSNPVVQMGDDPAATRRVWSRIGEVYWHYPVLRAKPAATVLLRHGDPRMQNAYGAHVLAAVHYAGAGRAAFLAFDGSWRWRKHGEVYFDRFWIQMMRYLVEGRKLGGTRRTTLVVEGATFHVGMPIHLSARLLDVRYQPRTEPRITAEYTVEGERFTVPLAGVGDSPGWYEGSIVPDRVGGYQVRLRGDEETTGGSEEAVRELYVTRPNIEVIRPRMDRDALVRIATGSNGGRYFEIDEATTLPEVIPDVHEETVVRSRPILLWDNARTLGLLVVLLAAEWIVRKWNRLL